MKKQRTQGHIETHGSSETKKPSKKKAAPSRAVPDGFSVENGMLRAHRIHTHKGVAILEWQASFPLPPEKPKQEKGGRGRDRIRSFYLTLATQLQAYIHTRLLPDAIRAYTQSEDPYKRFRHARLSLSVHCRVTEEDGRCLSVVRYIRLTRGGKCLHEHHEAEVLSQKSGKPLPLWVLRKMGFLPPSESAEKAKNKRKKQPFGGFFLSGGRILPITEQNS